MPTGFRVSSWIIAIATIVACYVPLLLLGVGDLAEIASESILDAAISISLTIVPLLQIVNLILGIIVAVRKDSDALSVTRAIMLIYKLGLIPFFILGGIIEVLCIIGGFHPILVGFMWVIGFGLAILGWLAVMSGSLHTSTQVLPGVSSSSSSGVSSMALFELPHAGNTVSKRRSDSSK